VAGLCLREAPLILGSSRVGGCCDAVSEVRGVDLGSRRHGNKHLGSSRTASQVSSPSGGASFRRNGMTLYSR
jgi:hypothetical protein